MKKKYIRTILVVALLAALGLGYYYYLSNRQKPQNEENVSKNTECEALIAKDIKNNYPESAKEVVKLYARITKAYYDEDLTDEQIEKLGAQARQLFDDELKNTQTDAEFTEALKKDISEYKSIKRSVSDYKIDGNTSVDYTTFQDRRYASINVVYYINDSGVMKNSRTKFTLRQDENKKWKILYWELDEKEDNTASQAESNNSGANE